MRCLSCKYDLRQLTEHRCPECGRAFDPDNPTTFDTSSKSSSRRFLEAALTLLISIIAALAIYVLFAFLFMMMISATISR